MARPLGAGAHDAGAASGEGREALYAFVTRLLTREDPALRAIREGTALQGLPPISVNADEGRLLHFLAKTCGARRVVEVGTLAGYSACWLAKALPKDGVVHTIEYDPKHAAAARENIRKAGCDDRVRVHEGAGSAVLPRLAKEGPFDLCFVDADKTGYEAYTRWAVDNVRPGGLVICDNAYLFGNLHRDDLPPDHEDKPKLAPMRAALALLADESKFASCAMIPTSQGMAVAVRR